MSTIKYVEAMIGVSKRWHVIEEIRDHECECDHDEPDDPVPLVPVGDPSTLQAQFDRLGFLRAEEVAIARLSDLRKLMNDAERSAAIAEAAMARQA